MPVLQTLRMKHTLISWLKRRGDMLVMHMAGHPQLICRRDAVSADI